MSRLALQPSQQSDLVLCRNAGALTSISAARSRYAICRSSSLSASPELLSFTPMLPVTSGAFTSSGHDQSVLSTAVKQLRRRFGRKLRRLFRKHRLLLFGLILALSLLWCFRRTGRAGIALPVAVSVMQIIRCFRSRSPCSDQLQKESTTSRFCHADEYFQFAASH